MNKNKRYQGFRKFSIKTRLVIALLLISIIPLAGISGYSFHIFSVALREKTFCFHFSDFIDDQSEYGK